MNFVAICNVQKLKEICMVISSFTLAADGPDVQQNVYNDTVNCDVQSGSA